MNNFLLDKILLIHDETTVFAVGLLGLLALVFLLPWRTIQVIRRLIKKEKPARNTLLSRLSMAFLLLSIYAVVEAVAVFATAKGGEVSGVMIPLYAFVPFVFYVLFEVFQAAAALLRPRQE